MTHEKYASCIEACIKCAQACEHCADSCLSEQNV
ncbi:MAG: four-helix bundle copper-binding protein, partial [Gimesia chilikensis]